MKRLKQKLFHISENDLNNKTIYPLIPNNYFTKNGYENASIARICFAPTVDQCLFALGTNLSNKEFNVYEPFDYDSLDIISNEEIVNKKYVPDAIYSNETWVISKVKLKFLFRILVLRTKNNPVTINYGNKTAECYYWEWEIKDS